MLYRIFPRTDDGALDAGTAFACWNDDLALGTARRLVPHRQAELWQGLRLVGTLSRSTSFGEDRAEHDQSG